MNNYDYDLFYIDFFTGELRTKVLLDYEINSTYSFYITAKDNDNLHSDRVLVKIELIDINDNLPIIDTSTSIYIPSHLLKINELLCYANCLTRFVLLINTILQTQSSSHFETIKTLFEWYCSFLSCYQIIIVRSSLPQLCKPSEKML